MRAKLHLRTSFSVFHAFQIELLFALGGALVTAFAACLLLAFLSDALKLGISADSIQKTATRPWFPVQVASALVLGYFAGSRRSHPHARRVWTIGVAWFLIHLALWKSPSVLDASWFAHFFGKGCRLPSCTDQIIVTAPLLITLAYSIGGLGAVLIPWQDSSFS